MPLALFKDLCADANDPHRLGAFWAAALGRRWVPEPGKERIAGPTSQHTVWVNTVPEAKTVKNRVHLDIYTADLGSLQALGSEVVLPMGEGRSWTVMAGPEGGEYCAFVRTEVPAERLHGLVVDSTDPAAQARWWAEVYGARLVDHPQGYSTVADVPGMPILTMDFVPVPEPKTVKNRVHWDVTVASVEPLVDAGAVVLRAQDDEVRWHVLADPEGNEFCAFVQEPAA